MNHIAVRLLSLAGVRHAEQIAGDLQEEFALNGSRLWLISQWVRTLAIPLTLSAAAIAIPALLLHSAWIFFYGTLCLEPVPGLFAANLVGAGTGVLGGRRAVIGGCALAFVAVASNGAGSVPYVLAILLTGLAGTLTSQLRRLFP